VQIQDEEIDTFRVFVQHKVDKKDQCIADNAEFSIIFPNVCCDIHTPAEQKLLENFGKKVSSFKCKRALRIVYRYM